MSSKSNGKKKAKVWYDHVVEVRQGGVAVFEKAQRPTDKHARRGF